MKSKVKIFAWQSNGLGGECAMHAPVISPNITREAYRITYGSKDPRGGAPIYSQNEEGLQPITSKYG
jgi:hypothetical protein